MASMLAHSLFALVWTLLANLAPCASAGAFLRSSPEEEPQVARGLVEQTFFSELSVDSARLRRLEDELRPMHAALPKNEHGTLDAATVRYALHRFFVRKHGWYVQGLEPGGDAWNASVPTEIMKNRVPAYIQSLFEQRLHGKGLGLHDLAVFAATLSDLVHGEEVARIRDIYTMLRLPTTIAMPLEVTESVVKTYIIGLILGFNFTIDSDEKQREIEREIDERYGNWPDLRMWAEDLRLTLLMEHSRNPFMKGVTFDHMLFEVREINHRLGSFQDVECRGLKELLGDLEHKGTGRVALSEYYRAGGDAGWALESAEYLRNQGALDESDPKRPSVIIANLIGSSGNCLTSSNFFSVCCLNECEALMGQLERQIASPSSTPERIAELVAGMRSDTVDAPRNLSAAMLSRLGEIAEHHKGSVPLHGRLFAQWMHHAYPLECPFPHTAGTTSPLKVEEWEAMYGEDSHMVSAAELSWHRDEAMSTAVEVDPMPWVAVEELVGVHRQASTITSWTWATARKVAAFTMLLASVQPLVRAGKAAIATPLRPKLDGHFV